MYSLLLESYIKDPQEKHRLFHAIENFPAIKRKADWALKWISRCAGASQASDDHFGKAADVTFSAPAASGASPSVCSRSPASRASSSAAGTSSGASLHCLGAKQILPLN